MTIDRIELMRLGAAGAEIPAVRGGDGVVRDLTGLTAEIDGSFLAADGIARVRAALRAGELPVLDGADLLRVGAPVARPQAVICIGQNYAAHAAESGSLPPEHPVVFFKHPNTVVGPFDEVAIPPHAAKTDWEVELAIVVGRRCSYLADEAAGWGAIAGFAVSNDVSERAFQIEVSGGQWSKGKSSPGFNPLGPVLVPADQVGPGGLAVRSWVNGESRQDSSTADMIFSPARLIWELSWFMALEAGDVINTGTPQGVALSGRFPYLRPGDVVECEIENLGRQRQVLTETEV